MDTRRIPIALAAAAAVIGAIWMRKRPVKPPTHTGAWKPRSK